MTDTERLDWLEHILREYGVDCMQAGAGPRIILVFNSTEEPLEHRAAGMDLRTAIDNAAHVLKP